MLRINFFVIRCYKFLFGNVFNVKLEDLYSLKKAATATHMEIKKEKASQCCM